DGDFASFRSTYAKSKYSPSFITKVFYSIDGVIFMFFSIRYYYHGLLSFAIFLMKRMYQLKGIGYRASLCRGHIRLSRLNVHQGRGIIRRQRHLQVSISGKKDQADTISFLR